MNIRFFRSLTALGLAAAIAVAGVGAALNPNLSIERTPASALSIEHAPDLSIEQQTADFYDAAPDLSIEQQTADFYDAVPDVQFALSIERAPSQLNPDLQSASFLDSAPSRLNPELQFG
jgi:hypothetical protein